MTIYKTNEIEQYMCIYVYQQINVVYDGISKYQYFNKNQLIYSV